MLTHEQVRSAAAELGLREYADGLVQAARPVYRLDPSADGAHRIGGAPDLVAGERWPRNARGVELTLIAQLDTSSIPPLPGGDDGAVGWLAAPAFVRPARVAPPRSWSSPPSMNRSSTPSRAGSSTGLTPT